LKVNGQADSDDKKNVGCATYHRKSRTRLESEQNLTAIFSKALENMEESLACQSEKERILDEIIN